MVDGWSKTRKTHLLYTLLFHALLIILILVGLIPLVYIEPSAQAQVIVIPPDDPDFPEVTLKLAGAGCDVNDAESAVLHLKGVLQVDIEAKKDHLFVAYDPAKVSPQQMVDAIGKKKGKKEGGGCNANIVGAGRP